MEDMRELSKFFKTDCVTTHSIRNFMLISTHIRTIDQKCIGRYIAILDYMSLEKYPRSRRCENRFTPIVTPGNI